MERGHVHSTLEKFNTVHSRKRGERIGEYLRSKVEEGDSKMVIEAMKGDFEDLNITVKL